jgi:NAD(P)-dependent dehydrogenase (short-subunit alcohol dehydrogenase family)
MDPSHALLTDQVAIVTGGGQGIGEGAALALARFGAHVVIADKNPDTSAAVAEKVREIGRSGVSIPTDVRDMEAVRAMVEQTVEQLGRVDILVNNAGGTRFARFLDLEPRGWQRHIELNLGGLFGPTDAAVRAMIDGGRGGSIINVASIEGSRAAPNFSVYAACKAGMMNFTRTLALELAEYDIRVNCIAPDYTSTPGIEGFDGGPSAEQIAAAEGAIPLGRRGNIEETAGPIVFLASRMAGYVTGVTLPVDGGTWASSGWVRDASGEWRNMPRTS